MRPPGHRVGPDDLRPALPADLLVTSCWRLCSTRDEGEREHLHPYPGLGRHRGEPCSGTATGLTNITGPTYRAAYNTKAEVRQIEPYVYCQLTHSKYSPRAGASRIPWLSGSAAWSYFAATQYILGPAARICGLRIDPCIPAAWPGSA